MKADDFVSAVTTAGQLLPEFIGWVRAMRRKGHDEDEMRRDIRSRTEEIAEMRAARDAELDAKFPATGESD